MTSELNRCITWLKSSFSRSFLTFTDGLGMEGNSFSDNLKKNTVYRSYNTVKRELLDMLTTIIYFKNLKAKCMLNWNILYSPLKGVCLGLSLKTLKHNHKCCQSYLTYIMPIQICTIYIQHIYNMWTLYSISLLLMFLWTTPTM